MASENESDAPMTGVSTVAKLMRRTVFLGLLAGAIAAVYTLTLKNEYAAESGLLLAPLPLNQAVQGNKQNPEQSPATQIGFLMGRPLSVPGYDVLLRNAEIVKQLRDKLTSLYAERGKEVDVPLEVVRESMGLRTTILKQTAYEVEYLPLITLSYKAADPTIAADMANEWSKLAIALSKDISAKGKTGSVEFLNGRFEQVNNELEETEKEIQEHETKWDIDDMVLRLQAMQELVTQYELDRVRLTTDIEDQQAQLQELDAALADTSEKTTLRKAPSDEAYWLMKATGKGNPDSSDVLESEVVNDLYLKLKEKADTLKSTVSGLIKKREVTIAALEDLHADVATLQQNLAEQTRVQTELKRRAEVSQDQYKRVAENLEAARIAEAETEPDLKIAYAAVPPERKVGPHRSVTVLDRHDFGRVDRPRPLLLRDFFTPFCEVPRLRLGREWPPGDSLARDQSIRSITIVHRNRGDRNP